MSVQDLKPEWRNAMEALKEQKTPPEFPDNPEWNNAVKALENIKSAQSNTGMDLSMPGKKGKKNNIGGTVSDSEDLTPDMHQKKSSSPPPPMPPNGAGPQPHPPPFGLKDQGPGQNNTPSPFAYGYPPPGMGYGGPPNSFGQHGYRSEYRGMGNNCMMRQPGPPPPPWMGNYGPRNFNGGPMQGPRGPGGPYGHPPFYDGGPRPPMSGPPPPMGYPPFGEGPRGPPPPHFMDMDGPGPEPPFRGPSGFDNENNNDNRHFDNQGPNNNSNRSFRFDKRQAPGGGFIAFQLPKRKNMHDDGPKDNPLRSPPNKFVRSNSPLQSVQSGSNDNRDQRNMDGTQTHKDGSQNADGGSTNENSSAPKDDIEWPQSLKDYVQRAFAAVQDETQKDRVEAALKQKLTKVFSSDGGAHAVDWDNEPLPLMHMGQGSGSPQFFGRGGSAMRFQHPVQGRWGQGAQRGAVSQRPLYSRDRVPTYRSSRSRSFSSSSSSSFRSRSRSRSPGRRRVRRRHGSSRSRSSSSNDSRSVKKSKYSSFGKNRGRGRKTPRGRGRGRGGRHDRDNSRSQSASSDDSHSLKNSKYPSFGKNRGRGRGRGGKGGAKGDGLSLTTKKNKNKANQLKFEADDNDPLKAARMQVRAARFAGELGKDFPKQKITFTINNTMSGANRDDDMDLEEFTVVGTCKDIEKPYLRLTGAPDPKTIRPVKILRKSLATMQEKWKVKADYRYICEQLKSIRQDLTVQGVRDAFTVRVYETHARIAMEKGDHEEFNQCQTQLKLLYQEGLEGNELEFKAYRILYYMYTSNTLDLTTALAALTQECRKDECIKHALEVRVAWSLNNYHRFFKLYDTAPKMSGYLMDWFIDRVRKNALKLIIKAYRPSLPIDFFQKELSYSDVAKCQEFLQEKGVTFLDANTKVDCKASMPVIQAL